MMEDKIKRGYGGGLQAIDFSDLSRQIEEAKKKSKLLQGSAISLVVVSLLIGYLLFDYFIGRYAVIEDLKMTQDSAIPRKIFFKYKVKTGGIVATGYEQALCEDIVTTGKDSGGNWTWTVDPSKKEFTVYTRSRWGIFPTWETKTFAVTGKQ